MAACYQPFQAGGRPPNNSAIDTMTGFPSKNEFNQENVYESDSLVAIDVAVTVVAAYSWRRFPLAL